MLAAMLKSGGTSRNHANMNRLQFVQWSCSIAERKGVLRMKDVKKSSAIGEYFVKSKLISCKKQGFLCF
jgi:hypothetical protein